MVVTEFFVYYDGWVFCLWYWLGFCVNGGSCVFCLLVVVGFFVYGGGCGFCLMVVASFFFFFSIVIFQLFIFSNVG